MSRLRREVRLFLVALQFLTRIPVPLARAWQDAWLNDCVRHFPVVGAIIGGGGTLVMWAAGQLWPAALAALLAVSFTVWLTGAFHEDGLSDTFDALGGAVTREKALAILKDPRIGSYGAIALILVTAARLGPLAVLLQEGTARAAAALLLAHVLGRVAPVAVMARLPYAGDIEHAKAKPLATSVRPINLWIALGWGVLATFAVALVSPGPARSLGALAAALAVAWAMVSWLRRRLGGYSGDTLGATEQLAEVAVLWTWAAQIPV